MIRKTGMKTYTMRKWVPCLALIVKQKKWKLKLFNNLGTNLGLGNL